MGPTSFAPKATVTNLGDLDFSDTANGKLPVHAFVQHPAGGAGVMYTEDFEGIMGFNEYEGDIEVIWDSEGPDRKL